MATRMQQRRGTAAEWTSADPVLAAGEIGYETDTGRFKFGDGATAWTSIEYFSSAADIIDGAPEALDTLNELAAALDDDANFAASVTSALGSRVILRVNTSADWAGSAASDEIEAHALVIESDTTKAKINGNVDTAVFADLEYLATETYVDTAIAAAIPETVSSEEVGYLNGVTSSIQDQINAVVTDLDTAESNITTAQADILTNSGDISTLQASVGTAETDITNLQSAVSGNDTDIADLQTDKADLDSPTFQGTVVLPATTSIGNVDATEIGYLDGVTAGVQSQIDGKLGTTTAAATYAPLSGPTFTGTVSLPSTTSIGDVDATELGYLDGVTSGVQSQLDAKAPIADPTFTGTVSGIDKTMVGLTNVDNTADTDKPVSTAQQTALDAKLDLAGGTMTGKITLDGDPTQALHAATKQYVDSAEAGLSTKPQVVAATTTNLSGTYDNGTAGVGATLNLGQLATLDIDGVTSWSLLDGILLKDQTTAAENGRWVVDQIGNGTDTDWILRRCSLCDTADEIPGAYIFVIDGTSNEQTGWVLHVDDPATFTVGTDDIDVYQFAGAGAVTAGTNVSVSGTQVSVVDAPVFAGTVDASAAGVAFSDGTQTKAGVPSLTGFTEKTASYTLDTLNHQDNIVEMNSGSAMTFTIPTNTTLAWPVGASMDIFQTGAGQVTIEGASGVTVNYTPGNKLRTQWSSATILKRATDSWVIYGDLTA